MVYAFYIQSFPSNLVNLAGFHPLRESARMSDLSATRSRYRQGAARSIATPLRLGIHLAPPPAPAVTQFSPQPLLTSKEVPLLSTAPAHVEGSRTRPIAVLAV